MITSSDKSYIIKLAHEHYFAKSGIELVIESHYAMGAIRVRLINKNLHHIFQFEIDDMINDRTDFQERVHCFMREAKRNLEKMEHKTYKTENFDYYYSDPFKLTHEEEVRLQEELEKVKSGFYANVKRNRKGNRLTKEEAEQYNSVEGFGSF